MVRLGWACLAASFGMILAFHLSLGKRLEGATVLGANKNTATPFQQTAREINQSLPRLSQEGLFVPQLVPVSKKRVAASPHRRADQQPLVP